MMKINKEMMFYLFVCNQYNLDTKTNDFRLNKRDDFINLNYDDLMGLSNLNDIFSYNTSFNRKDVTNNFKKGIKFLTDNNLIYFKKDEIFLTDDGIEILNKEGLKAIDDLDNFLINKLKFNEEETLIKNSSLILNYLEKRGKSYKKTIFSQLSELKNKDINLCLEYLLFNGKIKMKYSYADCELNDSLIRKHSLVKTMLYFDIIKSTVRHYEEYSITEKGKIELLEKNFNKTQINQ